MFIGEYTHSIDEKGRIAVPNKFRKELGKKAIVTRGLDQTLFIYTSVEWEKLAKKIAAMPLSHANSRAFSRLILAGAMEVQCDSQGRVMIPDYLRMFAKIKKIAVFAGVYNRIELWDAEKWEIYKKKTEQASNDIAEKLSELGGI